MSGYILCQVKKAEKPFYIENISTNIYSIEELCYYLYNNLYLVDSSLISSKLCTWLEEELELPKLAAKLKPYIGREAGLEEVLYPIFKEINYLAYEELKTLNGRIEARKREPEEIREKRKGDALMEKPDVCGMRSVFIRSFLSTAGKRLPERCVKESCITRDAHTVICSRWIRRWIAFGKHGRRIIQRKQ